MATAVRAMSLPSAASSRGPHGLTWRSPRPSVLGPLKRVSMNLHDRRDRAGWPVLSMLSKSNRSDIASSQAAACTETRLAGRGALLLSKPTVRPSSLSL